MPCYARACRLVKACASIKECQRVWHYCEIPTKHPHTWFLCRTCNAGWSFHTESGWHRDPLHERKVA